MKRLKRVFQYHVNNDVQTPRTVHADKKADFNTIVTALSCVWWRNCDAFTGVDEGFSYFYSMLYAAIKDNVPVINVKTRCCLYWYNAEIISFIKAKHRFRIIYKGWSKCFVTCFMNGIVNYEPM